MAAAMLTLYGRDPFRRFGICLDAADIQAFSWRTDYSTKSFRSRTDHPGCVVCGLIRFMRPTVIRTAEVDFLLSMVST